MENNSDRRHFADCWRLGFSSPVNPEGIIVVYVPTSPESNHERSNRPIEAEKEIEIRASDKERGSTSSVARADKEEAARRVLPPWIDPSYEWGGGKWKEDGRKKKKKEKVKESDEIRFNSGEKVEEEEEKGESYVEMLKAMGLKFP